ncbi:PD40 domain-containing protein [bacterium]|nr:PD40 domain-containing protein [bacterium]
MFVIWSKASIGQLLILILCFFAPTEVIAQDSRAFLDPEQIGPYMGQDLPGDDPQPFLPEIIFRTYRAHCPIVFSPDGMEAYWAVGKPPDGAVLGMFMIDGKWTAPEIIANMTGEPSFSPDGDRLYFISKMPIGEGESGAKENIWFMEKTSAGWSAAKPVGEGVNQVSLHFHHSVDENYNMYFSDYNDLYYSAFTDGKYQEAVDLGEFTGNNTHNGNSPYISPDRSYLLFAAKPNWYAFGRKHLFVSFRLPDGNWTDRISLGSKINAGNLNDSPRVTPDEKYIFFVSSGDERPWGIYWVSTKILEELRQEHLP